jgi:hypothetical protein
MAARTLLIAAVALAVLLIAWPDGSTDSSAAERRQAAADDPTLAADVQRPEAPSCETNFFPRPVATRTGVRYHDGLGSHARPTRSSGSRP